MFRRLAAAILILGTAAVLLLAAWPQLVGLQRTIGVAHLVSLRGLVLAGALALAVVLIVAALASRRFRRLGASLLVLVLAFAALNGVVLLTRGLGTADRATTTQSPILAPEGTTLTVLSWNTLGPATNPAQISQLALAYRADIVSLPETTTEAAIAAALRLREAGHPMWVLTQAYDQISPALSTSLLVSVDLGEYTFEEARTTAVLPSILATPVSGEGPAIVAVHAVAPLPAQMDNWRADLTALAGLCDGRNIIMAGDFNATIDHFSGFGIGSVPTGDRSGSSARLGMCTDAAALASAAAVGTWPTSLPPLLGTPIDHVLVSDGWAVLGMQVLTDQDNAGSDHRPVVAWLAPRR